MISFDYFTAAKEGNPKIILSFATTFKCEEEKKRNSISFFCYKFIFKKYNLI